LVGVTKYSQTIVDGNNYYILLFCQERTIVSFVGSTANDESSPVNPELMFSVSCRYQRRITVRDVPLQPSSFLLSVAWYRYSGKDSLHSEGPKLRP